MPKQAKTGPATHPKSSSFLTLLSGWVQQGMESFFATQRILVDLAMRQNAAAMKSLREGLSDPEYSPVAILTEMAVEGTSSFVEAQRILLNLARQENDLVLNGVKERVTRSNTATAMTDLVRRSIDTFIDMQQEFLKITSTHAVKWLEAAKNGKAYDGAHLVEVARQSMDHFVRTQKKFLDIIAQETSKATSGGTPAKVTRTEVSKLAREATNAFIEAQKKLLDVAGQQMNVNLEMATRTMKLLNPARLLPMANLTGESVKSFVDAEKALIENIIKPHDGKRAPVMMKPKRARKAAKPRAAAAGAA